MKGKPQITADDITGFDRYVDQEGLAEFRQLREEIDPAVEAELFLETTLDPEAGIKEIKKYVRKEHGVKYSARRLGITCQKWTAMESSSTSNSMQLLFRLCLLIKVLAK